MFLFQNPQTAQRLGAFGADRNSGVGSRRQPLCSKLMELGPFCVRPQFVCFRATWPVSTGTQFRSSLGHEKLGDFAWITHLNAVASLQQRNLFINEFDDECRTAGEGFNQLPAT